MVEHYGQNLAARMKKLVLRGILLLANGFAYAAYPGLVWKFRRRLGYFPNVCAPRTKNEKFLWRKLFDRNPTYCQMSDKLKVRSLVAERCPDLAYSEIVWIGTSASEIPTELFTPLFIIKTNNGSSRNIVTDGHQTQLAEQRAQLQTWVQKPYGVRDGQWSYATITPRIFVERRIVPEPGEEFVDISCHVLLGRSMLVTVDKDVKQDNERIAVYDADGARLRSTFRARHRSQQHLELPDDYVPPETLPRAIAYAQQIAHDCDYIRVDFMSTGQRLFFCECTIFPMEGYSLIADGADDAITAAWDLRQTWFMRHPQRSWRSFYARLLTAYLCEPAEIVARRSNSR